MHRPIPILTMPAVNAAHLVGSVRSHVYIDHQWQLWHALYKYWCLGRFIEWLPPSGGGQNSPVANYGYGYGGNGWPVNDGGAASNAGSGSGGGGGGGDGGDGGGGGGPPGNRTPSVSLAGDTASFRTPGEGSVPRLESSFSGEPQVARELQFGGVGGGIASSSVAGPSGAAPATAAGQGDKRPAQQQAPEEDDPTRNPGKRPRID